MMNITLLRKILIYRQQGLRNDRIAWLLGVKIGTVYHLLYAYKHAVFNGKMELINLTKND